MKIISQNSTQANVHVDTVNAHMYSATKQESKTFISEFEPILAHK